MVSPALRGVLSGGSFVPPNALKPVDCGWRAGAGLAEDEGVAEPLAEEGVNDEPKPVDWAERVEGEPSSFASLLPKEELGWNGLTDDPAKPVGCEVRKGAEGAEFVEGEKGEEAEPGEESDMVENGVESEEGVKDEEKGVLLDVAGPLAKGEFDAVFCEVAVDGLLVRARSEAMLAKRPPVFCAMSGVLAAAAASFSRSCLTNAEKASSFGACCCCDGVEEPVAVPFACWKPVC